MPKRKIQVGIVGLGRSGWNIHAAVLAEHPRFDVVAAADPVAERRDEAKARFGCSVHTTPSSLLAEPQVDLVVIATPSHTHHSLAIDALDARKDVVVEKPMAETVAEIDEMIAAAERSGRILTSYQPRRLETYLLATQEIVDSGRLGRVVMIRSARHRYARRGDWQTLRKFGGGQLSVAASHVIDQVLLLLGDGPIDVFADLQHTLAAGDAEDHVKVCLRNSAGVLADIEDSLCGAFPRREWSVIGTTGSIAGTDQQLTVRWLADDTPHSLTADEGPAAGRRYYTDQKFDWREETLDVGQDRHERARAFYDKLDATLSEEAPLFVTPQSVRRQIEIIERARAQTARPL